MRVLRMLRARASFGVSSAGGAFADSSAGAATEAVAVSAAACAGGGARATAGIDNACAASKAAHAADAARTLPAAWHLHTFGEARRAVRRGETNGADGEKAIAILANAIAVEVEI